MPQAISKTKPAEAASHGLATLLQLEREARLAADEIELLHVIANDTFRLVPYTQALVAGARLGLVGVSGGVAVDRNGAFAQWIERLLAVVARRPDAARPGALDRGSLGDAAAGWEEHLAANALWCPLMLRGERIGALLLHRAQPFAPHEIAVLERLAEAYGHAWAALRRRRAGVKRLGVKRLAVAAVAAAMAGALALPMTQTVLAPAEVVARNAAVVSAGVDGVIAAILVRPGEAVRAGQTLFTLDRTTLQAQHDVARRSLAVTEAEHHRAAQKAFTDADSKAELAVLKARIAEKAAELAWTEQMLARTTVAAPRDGVAVFNDPAQFLGKPVAVGERVMLLVDPDEVWLQIWLAVDDAIGIEPGASVAAFLNIDPVRPRHGRIVETGFEAELSPDGVPAYNLKAAFAAGEAPRLGLKAAARIAAGETTLAMYLFRRPLAVLRRWIGW